MAETQTPNFKWIKPDVGGDASIWGVVLNTLFDAIDAAVWANQGGVNGIGAIAIYTGDTLPANGTAPTNYLWCNGAVYLDTDIPLLAPIMKKKFFGSDASHSAVPNLWSGRGPVGYDGGTWAMGATGGEQNHTLLVTEMPSHGHTATEAPHNHPASQDAHAHYLGLPAHTHSITQDAHAHGVGNTSAHSHVIATGSHAHNLTRNPASNVAGANVQAGSGWAFTDVDTDTVGNLGGNTDSQALSVGNTDTRTPLIHCDTVTPPANTYATDARTPGTYTGNAQPAITVAAQGGGAAANIMQPYTVVAFMIRYR